MKHNIILPALIYYFYKYIPLNIIFTLNGKQNIITKTSLILRLAIKMLVTLVLSINLVIVINTSKLSENPIETILLKLCVNSWLIWLILILKNGAEGMLCGGLCVSKCNLHGLSGGFLGVTVC